MEKLFGPVYFCISFLGIGTLMLNWYLSSHSLTVIDRLLNVVDDQGIGKVMVWKKVLSSATKSSVIQKIMGYVMVITIMLSMFGYYFDESHIILPVAFQFGIMIGIEKKSRILSKDLEIGR